MSDTPFLGELRLMSFNFPPRGWASCDGQILQISQNQALFSLLGVMYGGNGTTTFALPDLRGRAPVHRGPELTQGQVIGEETHALVPSELPAHTHQVMASSANADQSTPGILAAANNLYRSPSDLTTIHPQTIPNVGGSQPHENRPPFLVLCWSIALSGIFPSRT
jgi:microcystin-dependent protein